MNLHAFLAEQSNLDSYLGLVRRIAANGDQLPQHLAMYDLQGHSFLKHGTDNAIAFRRWAGKGSINGGPVIGRDIGIF